MKGTSPRGIEDEREASRFVRDMFVKVAPRYDFLNHLLSFNIDRWWRRRTVKALRRALVNPHPLILDVCCGTGDLALALKRATNGRVLGSDFCFPMLTAARTKSEGLPMWFEADALSLPVRDYSLDAITVAFGFRNLVDYDAGLREMKRVLKPGGVAAILEFSTPPNVAFAALYRLYSHRILPAVGSMLSGSREAYAYLPESVRKFPAAGALAERMQNAGFSSVSFERMTFGVVALHLGRA